MDNIEGLIKLLAEWIVECINKTCDQECPHCGNFLEYPTSEDIENWLKGEK